MHVAKLNKTERAIDISAITIGDFNILFSTV